MAVRFLHAGEDMSRASRHLMTAFAFATAFKRQYGTAPGKYRRQPR
jgi:AraC-like DNA-binding protein